MCPEQPVPESTVAETEPPQVVVPDRPLRLRRHDVEGCDPPEVRCRASTASVEGVECPTRQYQNN
jgi:hypothetical protein